MVRLSLDTPGPRLDWFPITRFNKYAGELLSAFELLLVSGRHNENHICIYFTSIIHACIHVHLCCFALFVCLTLLASFFLPSHLSLKTCILKPLLLSSPFPSLSQDEGNELPFTPPTASPPHTHYIVPSGIRPILQRTRVEVCPPPSHSHSH